MSAVCQLVHGQGCEIDGQVYVVDQENPENVCEICDPAQNREDWSNNDGAYCADDGQFCNGDEMCWDGQCGHTGDPCLPGWTCQEGDDICTAVELISFEATGVEQSVLLSWKTAAEPGNAGFHLLRAEAAEGDYRRITAALIPAEGNEFTGADYEWIDAEVEGGRTYWYKLEDIDLYGQSAFHGPVEATVEETEPVFSCGMF